jgi:hypothetical protein
VAEAVLLEDLLSQMSSAFIRVTAGLIDREIVRWLEWMVLVLGFDRSTLAQIDAADGMLYATHQ